MATNINVLTPLISSPLPHTLEGYSNSKDIFTRHDKNIANNVSDFLEYGVRAKLCMNLTLYFQYVYSRNNPNIFGRYNFDVKHFCELFEWTDSSLQRVVTKKDELYITEHRNDIYRAFKIDDNNNNNENAINNIERFAKTKIGDAFFRLKFQDITYSNKSSFFEEEKRVIYSGKSITFLVEFMAEYIWIKGKASRLKIEYVPNEKSLLNNVKVFAYTNCNFLGKLRKTDNLDFLHLYIGYVLNTLKTSRNKDIANTWNINRNLMAKLLGLNPKRNIYELNKEIRRKLNKYQKLEVKDVEPFEWYFSENDFSITLKFPKIVAASKEQVKMAFDNAFKSHFEKKLYEVYIEQHASLEDEALSFREWLFSPNVDVEQKKFAYLTSQRVIYNNKSLTINKLSERDLKKIGLPSMSNTLTIGNKEKNKRKVYPGEIASN